MSSVKQEKQPHFIVFLTKTNFMWTERGGGAEKREPSVILPTKKIIYRTFCFAKLNKIKN